MRSTVDSSGNPEHGGETEYGTVPVREWVGPGGAGSVTDAWAARAAAEPGDPVAEGRDAVPVADGLPVRDAVPGRERGVGREAPPLFAPVSVSVPAGGEVVVDVPGPEAGTPSGSGTPQGSDADSVVDLVLDLVPGEDDRRGPLGATTASVSVPSAAGAEAAADAEADAEADAKEPADAVPVAKKPADAVPVAAEP
ncbi:membrane protease subunit, partial [Streptomyces sp. SID9124]|nr:membrane protease subunit [Streptomyces sp. SID9124]